jgi:hypothetical protein
MRLWAICGVVLAALTVSQPAEAACGGSSPTWTAAANTPTDVSDCHTAASNGDTILIPGTTSTWTTGINITKGITIRGASDCTLDADNRPYPGSCSTVIRHGLLAPDQLIMFNVPSGQTARLAHMEFNENGGVHGNAQALDFSGGSYVDSRAIRIDHVVMDDIDGAGIYFGFVRGVIDHSYFDFFDSNRVITQYGITGGDGAGVSDPVWAAAPRHGTNNCLYFEDNTLSQHGPSWYAVSDLFSGGCAVFRFNDVVHGWLEVHGTDSVGRSRGGREIEAYRNDFACSAGCPGNPIVNLRSSAAIVFENAATGAGYIETLELVLSIQRVNASHAPFGQATGSNEWDNNSGGVLVRALDQPCRGQGGLIENSTPTHPWANGAMDQVTEYCYEWNNLQNGSTDIDYVEGTITPALSGVYRNDVTNGTSLPGTCTVGDGYWKTDEGEWWAANAGNDGRLYKCTSTNTWTLYYTPYVYPHPLNDGQGGGTPNSARPRLRGGRRVELLAPVALALGLLWAARRRGA